MELSDIFFAVLYGAAFFLVIYFIMGLFYKPAPSTVVIYGDETPVYQESLWWPWAGGPYNYWPYWGGWWSGGGDGGYGYYRGGRGGHPRQWTGGRPWGGGGRGANVGGHGGGGHGGGGGHR